jgi:hypothetical protein
LVRSVKWRGALTTHCRESAIRAETDLSRRVGWHTLSAFIFCNTEEGILKSTSQPTVTMMSSNSTDPSLQVETKGRFRRQGACLFSRCE